MLDSDHPPVMGRAMALQMTPPLAAPDFLARSGWGDAQILPLAGDASFRRYFRVTAAGRNAVLMDAPPPHEDPRPFVHVAQHLTGIGLRAPAILASDLDAGLLLIEDFGDHRMREVVDADVSCEQDIYRGVVDVLIALHRHPPAKLARHGLDDWIREVGLFTEWYCPHMALQVDQIGFQQAWQDVLEPIDSGADRWVTELRDYHAENVMLTGGQGTARYGLLDFQDARVGHPAYDLVSMLQDARRDVSPAIEAEMLHYYMEATERLPTFADAYWALGAQRNTRILGLFVRLWKRDGKPAYRAFQSRMWGLLERDLAHPALLPVRKWFDANIPAEARADCWAHYV